jgi:hypothetical protein
MMWRVEGERMRWMERMSAWERRDSREGARTGRKEGKGGEMGMYG